MELARANNTNRKSGKSNAIRGCSSCCSFSVLPGAGEQVLLWPAVRRPQA
jgi:hypothetical protein